MRYHDQQHPDRSVRERMDLPAPRILQLRSTASTIALLHMLRMSSMRSSQVLGLGWLYFFLIFPCSKQITLRDEQTHSEGPCSCTQTHTSYMLWNCKHTKQTHPGCNSVIKLQTKSTHPNQRNVGFTLLNYDVHDTDNFTLYRQFNHKDF